MKIAELENGDRVVDLGNKWFRIKSDGSIIAKKILNGKVIRRPATEREKSRVLAKLRVHDAIHTDRKLA